jgi:hypothetical protein
MDDLQCAGLSASASASADERGRRDCEEQRPGKRAVL